MSKVDLLAKFDTDWNNHLKWRENEKCVYKVEIPAREAAVGIRLLNMPADIREAVLSQMNELVTNIVDSAHEVLRKRLVADAIQEAKETLDRLQREPSINVQGEVP